MVVLISPWTIADGSHDTTMIVLPVLVSMMLAFVLVRWLVPKQPDMPPIATAGAALSGMMGGAFLLAFVAMSSAIGSLAGTMLIVFGFTGWLVCGNVFIRAVREAVLEARGRTKEDAQNGESDEP